MNVIVCAKMVPDPEDIEVRPGGAISLERAEWGFGNFDLQAVEAGARLAQATGGKLIALSAGPLPPNLSKLKKDLLSRGPDELVLVIDEALRDAGTALTARVLAAAIGQIGAADLVLFGEGSADLYFQQVGLQVGELLGWPVLNAISRIDPEGDRLRVERSLEDEIEILDVPLPAALAVTTDINPPRLPTMKDILGAGKKPVREWRLADLGLAEPPQSTVKVIATRAPERAARKQIQFSGSPQEAAAALAEALRQEGLISGER